jgi:hypothetical protein
MEFPSSLLGPIATIIVVFFSIIARWGITGIKSIRNCGADLSFCSVGLQLSLLYTKMEEPVVSLNTVGWDPILLIVLMILWMSCLILIKHAPKVERRLGGVLNPSSAGAIFLGFLSLSLQIYWRLGNPA